MIKLVMCVHRRRDLTRAQFHDYWSSHHGPLFASFAAQYRAVRYVQSHTLDTPLNAAIRQARGMSTESGESDESNEFDGVGEIWWESEQDFVAAINSPEGKRLRGVFLDDEARFIDSGRSTAFFTEEHTLVGDPQCSPGPGRSE